MPLYTFEASDGRAREFLAPSTTWEIEHDGTKWRRAQVQRFAFVGQAPAPTLGAEVLRGYREQEQIGGSRFHTRLNPETIKRTWQNDREILQ